MIVNQKLITVNT
ncbi:hypothetical protein FWK35_00036139 [Aphis craccivora]|uniref:Uncharacterized protein n=2 Tax=Aphis craccivora TaxID=307492 RepID=A0A6G0VSL5_APHCR|nr:hypothetical protein FWK35_00036139 [Aphis craccivora]